MVKRARAIFDCESPAPPSPPAKRLAQSSPIRPRASSFNSTPFAYTIRTPLSVPQDSPTNPFGLKRSLAALELPRVTAFGKHICLRLQLVDSRLDRTLAAKRRDKEGGIFRVVQVPLNYTFRHLHKLILFLFASDISEFHSQLPSGRRTSLRSASANTTKAKGKARVGHSAAASQWGGHFFEVLKPASVHSNATKPGVIKATATVQTKLSSVRERRLFRDLLDPENSAGSSSDLPKTLEDEDVEKENWTWEAEDDFTLQQVWRRGPISDRGVIYRHQPDISVHITANTLPVAPRKGSGNTPHVFIAQGTAGALVRLAHVVPTDDGGEAVFPLPHGDLEPLLHPVTKAHIDRWNHPDAFPKFLRREAERERALQRAPPSPLAMSPTRAPVARPRDPSEAPTTVPSSDPLGPSSEPESELSDASAYSACSDSVLFPFAFSAITPYPAHPLHRKRMQRAERRMARLTKSGLVDMLSSDEEDAKKKAKGKEEYADQEYAEQEDVGQEQPAEDTEEAQEEVCEEEAKENFGEIPLREVLTYAKRNSRRHQTGRGRGITRSRKPAMDIIEWTPAPGDSPYSREWGSVEV